MKIIVDNYIPIFLKDRDYGSLVEGRDGFVYKRDVNLPELENEDIHVINWGENLSGYPHSVFETGFFWDAVHLDRHGLYTFCSFNFGGAREIVENYTPKITSKTMLEKGILQSKLRQPKEIIDWHDIVLICQHPTDRSVLKGGRTIDYRRFIESACKYYGKRLLLKVHPVNTPDEEKWLRSVAEPHGSIVARVNASVINNAEFVLVFNSTFVVDALLKGKPVSQYALGYFWKSGAVDYTGYQLPSTCKITNPDYGYKICDFLLWKYCFHKKDSMDNWAKIFQIFSTSNEMFPLPEDLSYGSFVASQSKLI